MHYNKNNVTDNYVTMNRTCREVLYLYVHNTNYLRGLFMCVSIIKIYNYVVHLLVPLSSCSLV